MFGDWLPNVLQQTGIFLSKDIAKGEPWYRTIMGRLSDSDVGVVFVTPENKDSPWLNFECGAMQARVDSNMRAVLIDLASADLEGPMKNTQLTDFEDKADFYKLIQSINNSRADPLEESRLEIAFNLHWPSLVEASQVAMEAAQVTAAKEASRGVPSKVDEILQLVRETVSSTAEARAELHQLSKRIPVYSEGLSPARRHEVSDESDRHSAQPDLRLGRPDLKNRASVDEILGRQPGLTIDQLDRAEAVSRSISEYVDDVGSSPVVEFEDGQKAVVRSVDGVRGRFSSLDQKQTFRANLWDIKQVLVG